MKVIVRKVLENTRVEMCCVTICFYEIWFNIIMVSEPAHDIESHRHLSVSIQYAETCMWRLVINK
jgi:hypothetical protein